MFSILNVKNGNFYICITWSLKVSDNATVESIRSTEWPSGYPDLNPMDYNVWIELKQLVCKNQRELFPWSYCNKELKIHGLSYCSITSDLPLAKREDGFRRESERRGVLFNSDWNKKRFDGIINSMTPFKILNGKYFSV
jgi:hypothetical protein